MNDSTTTAFAIRVEILHVMAAVEVLVDLCGPNYNELTEVYILGRGHKFCV